MRRTTLGLGMALLAAAVACGEGADARSEGSGPTGPRLSGATTHVTVTCPGTMDYGASATCTAYGYDASNIFSSGTVTSWNSSNTAKATVSSGGVVTIGSTSGSVTISAVIDGITGSTSINVVPPLSVTILGPSTVRSGDQCFYSAQTTGGTGSYSYSWTQQAGSGSSDGINGWFANTPSVSFRIWVTVTDGAADTATASKFVSVSRNAAFCMS